MLIQFRVLRLDIVQLMTQSLFKYLNTVDYSGIRLPVNDIVFFFL